MNILSILQSIVCQLIENTIDQQLWDETIDRPNCGTSSYTLIHRNLNMRGASKGGFEYKTMRAARN